MKSSAVAFTNPKKYIPPNRQNHSAKEPIRKSSTIKKEPKKEFSLAAQPHAFPPLNRSDNNSNHQPILSFANAAKAAKNVPLENSPSNILPGWIYIRKNETGEIEYKSGPVSTRYPCSNDNFDLKLSSVIFKHRLAKEQYARDNDVYRLGDFSEYYGAKTLDELFADEERLFYRIGDSDNSSSSEYSDSDDYNDTILYENKFENPNQ